MSRSYNSAVGMHGLSLHGTSMSVPRSKNGKRPKSASAVLARRRSNEMLPLQQQEYIAEGEQPEERQKPQKRLPYAKPILRKMVQLARTSDVYGSFVLPTVAQSLDLIRRCIQQRSKDGAAFSNAFKRFRGQVRYLTLSTFRATMIRMGINIPEPHYEALFNLFDNDRSGTIDFEEFSYWVMQGTADPERAAAGEAEESDDMTEAERKMLLEYVCSRLRKTNTIDSKTFGHVLQGMTAGRRGLIARAFKLILSRMNIGVTEREALAIFNTIDQEQRGIITVPEIIKWWEANVEVQETNCAAGSRKAAGDAPATFEEAVVRTTQSRLLMGLDALHEAFECYLQHSKPTTRLHYDEFRHAIRKLGIGKNERDMKSLFSFLTGSDDFVTLAELLRRTRTSFQLYTRPQTGASGSNLQSSGNKKKRLEREMREGLRLTYVKVKHAFEARDPGGTEHLKLETIKAILDAWCKPITYQDLRVVVQDIPRNEADELNYRELLHQLHPRRAGEQHHREQESTGNAAKEDNREVPRGRDTAAPSSLRASLRSRGSSPSPSSNLFSGRPRTAPTSRDRSLMSLGSPLRPPSGSKHVETLRSASRQSQLEQEGGQEETPVRMLVPSARASGAGLPSTPSTRSTVRASTPTPIQQNGVRDDVAVAALDAHPPATEPEAHSVFVEQRVATPVRSARPASANGRLLPSSAQSVRSRASSPSPELSTEHMRIGTPQRRPTSARSARSPSPRGRQVPFDADEEVGAAVNGTAFTAMQERLKPKWKLVKIAFHELDSKQTGLVTQHDFELILRIFDVFELMSEEEFMWLSARYRKDAQIWYVGFLRDLLQDVQHITPARQPRPTSARPPRSKPMIDSPGKPVRLRRSLLNASELLPDDLSTVGESADESRDMNENYDDDGGRSVSSRCSTSSQRTEHGGSVLVARVAPFVVASWKDIRVKLKALQSAEYPGNVTAADLSGVLYSFGVSLNSAEIASLPRTFPLKVTVRSRAASSSRSFAGIGQLVDYNAFMRACFSLHRNMVL